ncbi:glycosyltransferase WbsX family protein [Anaerostipes sp.]|uniref:glycosyltransferase WbsX family protein n=1 Tax=Anaerostipes sp. TaxID=1872530 RepID=UPI00257D8264|nr:glycoside hydrolase family 99-like domain-containing protein [Anaerostipes sp.]
MKIIAFYLPQFHEIPENSEWWGEGFTEWVNVKKARPLFEGHNQPKVPLNKNYYNLLDPNVQIWQAKIAKEYGVYGFCYYHYWFNGKLLLEKPMEAMLNNPNVDLPFCICWANEPWTKAWVGEKKILIPQVYGERKNWEEHFDYLLPFLKDKRYITDNGKPLLVIYRPEVIPKLNEMLDCWSELAKDNGFQGISFAYQNIDFDLMTNKDDSRFDYNIEFQPLYGEHEVTHNTHKYLKAIRRKLAGIVERKFGIDLMRYGQGFFNKGIKKDYDMIWETILKMKPKTKKNVPGAFVNWDNTPRKGNKGSVFCGAEPKKFERYLSEQIRHTKNIYKKDMLFMYAWNEWAEGGYLEPDESLKYGNLEAIRNALNENNEFPIYPK